MVRTPPHHTKEEQLKMVTIVNLLDMPVALGVEELELNHNRQHSMERGQVQVTLTD